MDFYFDNVPSRLNTNCVKWDEALEGVLPLWVADMDFPTAPCVQESVIRRAQHPCYGYTIAPDSYYQAIIGWFWNRHDWRIRREEILYTIGVVPAIAAILKAVTQMGDNVVIISPIYNCFYNLIRNAGCQKIEVEAVATDKGFDINWDELETALAQEKSTVLLWCNPHNPLGRIWTKEEMQRVAQLCQKHGVMVISDEIHNELTRPGVMYTPWGTIGEEYQQMAAICTSPSKSFNIAGLQNANIIVRDPELRRKVDRAINLNETCDVNPFGIEAVTAAYNEGGEWLDALREYIWANYDFAREFLNNACPALKVAPLDATYLMWVDCSAVYSKSDLSQRLMSEAKVWFNDGNAYGKGGDGHLRINLATSRQTLTEALNRFFAWLKTNC